MFRRREEETIVNFDKSSGIAIFMTDSSRKLFYLSLEAPHLGSASHTHVHEIMAGLKKRGWKASLYEPFYTQSDSSPGLLKRLLGMLWLQGQVWANWRSGSVLYVRGHYMAFPSAIIARLLNVPVFHEINGPYDEVFITHRSLSWAKPLLTWMQRLQFRWATGLIAVTEELRQWAHHESGGRPTYMITNAANTEVFFPGAIKPADVPERYALFFGGLAAWHGVGSMLDAASTQDWPHAVSLVIIGDGPEAGTVEKAALANPLIRFLGKRSQETLQPYIANACVSLVPISSPQGRARTGLFPLKLFETLACGVPVIVTDFPGQADLVRQYDCGLIIPADDAQALARAVALLVDDADKAQAMGKRGAQAIHTEHNWDKRAQKTHEVLLPYLNLCK